VRNRGDIQPRESLDKQKRGIRAQSVMTTFAKMSTKEKAVSPGDERSSRQFFTFCSQHRQTFAPFTHGAYQITRDTGMFIAHKFRRLAV
jgi:hypothetical protein